MTETTNSTLIPLSPSAEKIVVVGAHTQLGEQIIQELEKRPEVKEYWVVDLHSPKKRAYQKLRFIQLDLIAPGADATLAEELKKIGASCILHTALKNNPSLNWVYAHELEVIGTLNLVSAAKAAQVKKFILCSTTAVYGASPKNPNYLTESHPVCEKACSYFVKDKIEAEKQVLKILNEAPQITVTLLRFCLIVGPRSHNYFTELFRRSVVPTLLGYDPLMQFIHERDAIRALKLVLYGDHPGVFNIVGRGVIPLSYALRKAGKWSLPLWPALAYPSIQSLWNLQMVSVPARLLDFFRYSWVADGSKASEVLGFEAKRSSKDAFLEFAKSERIERMSLSA
ncbi:MAG: NAD-dependent epimerase/dehydratase family protein [Bradymonadales bacterium]|nr:MAG: NAD-dependent epimerase/dehydratase family protein [Bradymonadales bacterium]